MAALTVGHLLAPTACDSRPVARQTMNMSPVFLIVAEAILIHGRGTAVLFAEQPRSFLDWKPHRVKITTPHGSTFDAVAHAEYARKVPPGEVQALMFSDLVPSDIPVGSRVVILDVVA